MTYPPRIFLGFDFYGAGNIGDDLMIKGFLKALSVKSDPRMICSIPEGRIWSQKRRFNQIDWLFLNEKERRDAIENCDYWLGIGGTPFQTLSGRWLLNKIYKDLQWAHEKKKLMIGVGCEEEVIQEKFIARKITTHIDHIWTRDEKSRSILIDHLGADSRSVFTGGDLAHIALQEIFADSRSHSESPRDLLGIVYYSENYEPENLRVLKKFLTRVSEERKIMFIANDIRQTKGFEYSIYKKLWGRINIVFRRSPEVVIPDYGSLEIRNMVKHYLRCETVIASRYHAILIAAWAGCRVVALDRSSKIRYLAEELNIPLVEAPFTLDKLSEACSRAETISKTLLEEKVRDAEGSVKNLWNLFE